MNRIKFNRHPNHLTNFANLFDEVLAPAFNEGIKRFNRPATNIKEAEGNFSIEIAAPGLNKADFDIKVEKDQLIVSASDKKESNENADKFTRKEFNFSNFKRSFHLPEILDGENIEAKYEAGILTLVIPKKEEAIAKTKVITVN